MDQQQGERTPSGSGRSMPQWTGFTGKTLWDWLQLLLIPLALAAIAFGLNYFANERDQRREDRRAAQERTIAAEGRREDTLRIYLQQMASLMLDRGLRTSSNGSQVQAVGRAFTLTALRRLDPGRKALVVRFLAQAGLIGSLRTKSDRLLRVLQPKIDLSGADLRSVPLRADRFAGTDFEGADLRGADFRGSLLLGASFANANLTGADFRGTHMAIRGGIFPATRFSGACVTGASFARAWMAGVLFDAWGWNVDFTKAWLKKAEFYGGEITQAKLEGANTDRAYLPAAWTSTGLPKRSQGAVRACTSWAPPSLTILAPNGHAY